MKLPDPVGEVVDWDSMGSPYVHWRNKPGAITDLYTEAQMREALAQQERDTADGFAIAHLNGHDQAKRRYEAVMRQALSELSALNQRFESLAAYHHRDNKKSIGFRVCTEQVESAKVAIKSLEDALK